MSTRNGARTPSESHGMQAISMAPRIPHPKHWGLTFALGLLAACGADSRPLTADANAVESDGGLTEDAELIAPDETPDLGAAEVSDNDAGASREEDGGGDTDVERDAGSSEDLDPVLFVHGINGSSADFAVMLQRLVDDGWPADHLWAITFPDLNTPRRTRSSFESCPIPTPEERCSLPCGGG